MAASVCTNLRQKRKLSKKGSPGEIWTGFRSSCSQIFLKTGVLKNFEKTPVLEILFDKAENPEDSIKKKLQYRFFPVRFAKFLKTFFHRTAPVAASDV